MVDSFFTIAPSSRPFRQERAKLLADAMNTTDVGVPVLVAASGSGKTQAAFDLALLENQVVFYFDMNGGVGKIAQTSTSEAVIMWRDTPDKAAHIAHALLLSRAALLEYYNGREVGSEVGSEARSNLWMRIQTECATAASERFQLFRLFADLDADITKSMFVAKVSVWKSICCVFDEAQKIAAFQQTALSSSNNGKRRSVLSAVLESVSLARPLVMGTHMTICEVVDSISQVSNVVENVRCDFLGGTEDPGLQGVNFIRNGALDFLKDLFVVEKDDDLKTLAAVAEDFCGRGRNLHSYYRVVVEKMINEGYALSKALTFAHSYCLSLFSAERIKLWTKFFGHKNNAQQVQGIAGNLVPLLLAHFRGNALKALTIRGGRSVFELGLASSIVDKDAFIAEPLSLRALAAVPAVQSAIINHFIIRPIDNPSQLGFALEDMLAHLLFMKPDLFSEFYDGELKFEQIVNDDNDGTQMLQNADWFANSAVKRNVVMPSKYAGPDIFAPPFWIACKYSDGEKMDATVTKKNEKTVDPANTYTNTANKDFTKEEKSVRVGSSRAAIRVALLRKLQDPKAEPLPRLSNDAVPTLDELAKVRENVRITPSIVRIRVECCGTGGLHEVVDGVHVLGKEWIKKAVEIVLAKFK